jgi:hypothetical protein
MTGNETRDDICGWLRGIVEHLHVESVRAKTDREMRMRLAQEQIVNYIIEGIATENYDGKVRPHD